LVTEERLKELWSYNPEDGLWTALVTRRKHLAGRVASTIQNSYISIKIDGVNYLAHRLAFLYMKGYMPEECVDHINRVRTDNRFCNLRECSKEDNAQNKSIQRNNKSGYIGVTWDSARQKWRATIGTGNARKYLGLFTTKEEARGAYLKAKSELHTFHSQPIQ
jgi:hypothetical protein